MAHRAAPRAEFDLSEIWSYIATESGSIEVADRVVDSISSRYLLPASFPYMGRSRDEDFGGGSRSFAVGDYVIIYAVEGDDVLVLRVVHGRRQIEALFAL